MSKQINITVSDEEYATLQQVMLDNIANKISTRFSLSALLKKRLLDTYDTPKQDPRDHKVVQETPKITQVEVIKEVPTPCLLNHYNANHVFTWPILLPWLKDEIETAERINKPSRPGLYDRLLSSLGELDLVKKSRVNQDTEE